MRDETSSANPGFALGQLARALKTAREHPDASTRERARDRAEAWLRTFTGMVSGRLRVGDRQPLDGVPAWATPRVQRGGFPTGELLAGGPLLPFERALLAERGERPAGGERRALNTWFASPEGQARLSTWLASGAYRVRVPEEGALAALCWLLCAGRDDEADALLAAIEPWFDRLRFYPRPADSALPDGDTVALQDVATTREQLRAVRQNTRFAAMREAIEVWAPLYDRCLALFAQTVEGPHPELDARRPDGSCAIRGGWPCQRYPAGWAEHGRALLADYEAACQRHRRCGRQRDPRRSFAILRAALARCLADPAQLTGREVGRVRMVLACAARKRGVPGSTRHVTYRADQARQLWHLPSGEAALLLAARLDGLDPEAGLATPEAHCGPLGAADGAPEHAWGAGLPEGLQRIVLRSLEAAPEELIAWGVLSSAELFAQVLPELSGRALVTGTEPSLRGLLRQLYGAFRRRRSLLLLQLQSQVRLGELPWVAPFWGNEGTAAAREAARALLVQVVVLALRSWPQALLPNPLLTELRPLARAAGLELPLVPELAADIFQGAFAGRFLRAAQHSATVLEGRLYARYYQLPAEALLGLDDIAPLPWGPRASKGFTALCYQRAGLAPPKRGRFRPEVGGAVIEQAQILTTHNLAALWEALALGEALDPAALARRCLEWIAATLAPPRPRRARLRRIKNAAYAWRQMVFFLSWLEHPLQEAFAETARGLVEEREPALAARLEPAFVGLDQAVAGEVPQGAGRPFLGWTTTGKHWLLDVP